jgi:hypothetical protein
MTSGKYLCPKCKTRFLTRGAKAGSGKVRWTCRATTGDRKNCYQTTDPTAPYRGKGEPDKKLQFNAPLRSTRLVITWAQNATPIHTGFFAALRAYCKKNTAHLIVVPGRYKNPTSTWDASQRNEQYWAPELVPYLVNQRKQINKNLMLLADIHTQPTAVTPLSGFEGITHGESGILAHPKLQMVVIPTPHQRLPKVLTTTGAVTVENYTDTKAGKKGEFHHVIGAVVIELDGDKFHLRHINARNDGAFVDLESAYYPSGAVEPCGAYEGLVFGDAHPQFADPAVVGATFGPKGLVERLQPKTLVFHDLLDSYAVNPHHVGNPFIASVKRQTSWDDIQMEVKNTIDWLMRVAGKRNAVIVPSNHDDMLSRYIKRQDWKEDPTNMAFYLETALHMVKHSILTKSGVATPDPFHYWVEKYRAANVYCLPRNKSFTIAGIECGLHGHEGPNGARGSMKNLSTLGAKVISGHSHTPGIEAGHYRTGTMTYLQLEYTGPISSWLNAHVSVDPFGKRHIHICVEGRFWK